MLVETLGTVVDVIVVVLIAGVGAGYAAGRWGPRRGRHARPIAPWSLKRWEDWNQSRRDHPSAQDVETVDIDLRAWLPADAGDAEFLRAALARRRPAR